MGGRAFALTLLLLPSASWAEAQRDTFVTGFGGIMTDDTWGDALQLWQTRFVKSGFAGVAFGQPLATAGSFGFGYEVQAVQHFGEQTHQEGNLPLVLRYHIGPDTVVSSVAYGLGLSWVSEKPRGELRRKGDANATQVYWMGEIEFNLPETTLDAVVRLHHRSDAYGLFPVDNGSNAFALGLRHRI